MPVQFEPPGSLSARFQPNNPRAAAQHVWEAWNRGVSPNTLGARRGDLALFGDHAWHVRGEIAVIRRVIEALADGSEAIHERLIAWIDSERARGIASRSLARRWSTIASLVRAIVEHLPRARGVSAPSIPPMPMHRVDVDDAAAVRKIVSRCVDASAFQDATILGLIGELGHSPERVAGLRVVQIAAIVAAAADDPGRICDATRTAMLAVCRDRRPSAYAFPGQRRGRPISRRGVEYACERHGTTAAALLRAHRGSERGPQA